MNAESHMHATRVRRFLYITPYFPPLARVGALRPLKFVRHLEAFGWQPVVLSDPEPGGPSDDSLTTALPGDLTVVRDYTWGIPVGQSGRADSTPSGHQSLLGRLFHGLPAFLKNPDLLPLSDHALGLVHSFRAAGRALNDYRCEAIVVNADPYEALLVGAGLARRTGRPLILDLRDPWSVCSLRRPLRPYPTRRLVDWLERYCVSAAQRVVLNTETALGDYRRHYPDLDPERFTCIPHHVDPSLFLEAGSLPFDRFTLLYLGRFRRFVEGEVLLRVLGTLKHRGFDADRLQLVVTGDCPEPTWELARSLGVAGMIRVLPVVPHREIRSLMDGSDLLVVLSNRTDQRIPAKLLDYATSRRPILVLADNPELEALAARWGSTRVVGLDAIEQAADHIERAVRQGRQRSVPQRSGVLTSREASAQLAGLLDGVTRGTEGRRS